MDAFDDIPTLDPHAFHSVMKIGGKKRLDALMGLLNESGPARIREIKEATSLSEAKAAASVLKSSASNLGLARLEDLCDQIIDAKTWSPNPELVRQLEQSYRQGREGLQALRDKI
jgi:hypothetical protein